LLALIGPTLFTASEIQMKITEIQDIYAVKQINAEEHFNTKYTHINIRSNNSA